MASHIYLSGLAGCLDSYLALQRCMGFFYQVLSQKARVVKITDQVMGKPQPQDLRASRPRAGNEKYDIG